MRLLCAVFLLSFAALHAEQFDIRAPAGTIRVVSVVALDDNHHPHLVAVATNMSKEPIGSVRLCFKLSADSEQCSFRWSSRKVWEPGKNVTIDEIGKVKASSTAHGVTLEEIEQNVGGTVVASLTGDGGGSR